MDKTLKLRIRLGLFVLAGIFLLLAGIFYIGKQRNLFNPVVRINTTFRNIGGLEVGNNVRFAGINVGTVDDIRIVNDSTVLVQMIVQTDIRKFIRKDSKVRISSEGIIGDKVAVISYGSHASPLVNENDYLASAEPVETDDIIENLNRTVENSTIISEQLAEIFYDINNGSGLVSRLINDSTVADDFDAMMLNLRKSSRGLHENMEAAKHNIFFRNYFKKKREKRENRKNRKK